MGVRTSKNDHGREEPCPETDGTRQRSCASSRGDARPGHHEERVQTVTLYTCSICNNEFDPEVTGGDVGTIGMIPVQFCVWCGAGMRDYCEQFHPWYSDKEEEEDDDG